jgi:transposase
VNRQLKEAHHRLDALTGRLIPTEEAEPGQRKQHDVEILASLPGVGRIVLATLLAEAFDALQRRDYAALRSLAGVAPVTKRSGKSCIVVIRQACHDRLANAMYHWARVAVQHDAKSRAKYSALISEVRPHSLYRLQQLRADHANPKRVTGRAHGSAGRLDSE